jgi:hypothetical protein
MAVMHRVVFGGAWLGLLLGTCCWRLPVLAAAPAALDRDADHADHVETKEQEEGRA